MLIKLRRPMMVFTFDLDAFSNIERIRNCRYERLSNMRYRAIYGERKTVKKRGAGGRGRRERGREREGVVEREQEMRMERQEPLRFSAVCM